MRELREAALKYARRGWPVLPCRTDKTPYCANGVLDATTDEEQIVKWWERWPSANPAVDCGAAGFLVLDYDLGHDPHEVERALGGTVPPTLLTSATPRGGVHAFYRLNDHPPVASSTSTFAAHVDVRSFHGYVLLPPSRTSDGAYRWTDEGEPGAVTDALVSACKLSRDKHSGRDEWLIEPDLPENVDRAVAWLHDDARLAVEGRGGDHCAFATAAMMKSLGISKACALELMLEHWNDRCSPPWDPDELAVKVTNGYAYNTSPPGNCTPAYKVARTAKMFAPRVEAAGSDGLTTSSGRFRFVDRGGLEHVEPLEWLVPDLLPEGGYGLLVGPRSSLKSFVALDVALTVATGGGMPWEDWRAPWDAPEQAGTVLYVAGEGRAGILRRVRAWESLHQGGRRVEGLRLGDPVPRVSEGTSGLEPFLEGALTASPDGYRLVVIDTLGRAMQGVNENAQEWASGFTALVEEMQRSLKAAVLVLHHTGHEQPGRARGSSVYEADCDVAVLTHRASAKLLKLSMIKPHKDAAEWDAPRYVESRVVRTAMDEDSLALVRVDPGKGTKPSSEMTLELVDARVMMALRAHVGRVMRDDELARLTASWRPELKGGDRGETLGLNEQQIKRSWLPRLRVEECCSRNYYDPSSSRWVMRRLD